MNSKNENNDTKKEVWHIFDRSIKEAFSFSPKLLIDLINSLFHENYDRNMKQGIYILDGEQSREKKEIYYADRVVQILDNKFHFEFQMTQDSNICMRIYKYGISEADKSMELSNHVLNITFPQQMVFYFQSTDNTPNELQVNMTLPDKKKVSYTVPTFKVMDYSNKELYNQKLMVLIPFKILELKKYIDNNTFDKMSEDKKEQFITEIGSRIKSIINVLEIARKNDIIKAEEARRLGSIAMDLKEYVYDSKDYIKKYIKEKGEKGMEAVEEEFKYWDQIVDERIRREGLREGLQEGLQEGIQVGQKKICINLAASLRKKNSSDDTVLQLMELVSISKEEAESIVKEVNDSLKKKKTTSRTTR